jgi:ketosteroid isomerase-like protein
MSASNVELIRRIFPSGIDMAAVMRSDDPAGAFQADPDAVAPDLEVKFAASPAGAAGFEGRGLEGLVEGWQDWLIPWESYVITVDEFVDAGDKVVTLVRIRGRTSRDGVEVEHRPAAVWTVGDGQVTAVTFFLDRDEAFEFAGIGG